MDQKLKEWYDNNREIREDSLEYGEEAPPETIYDGYLEFVKVINLISDLAKSERSE